jgi:hypothetical protein
MTATPMCWKCGAALADLLLPLARLAECPACRAELHVCRSCVYYDTRVANQCREPVAEPVSDKTRANFCGYFQFLADAWQPQAAAQEQSAHAQLNALFGGAADAAQDPTDATRSALDELFGGKPEK